MSEGTIWLLAVAAAVLVFAIGIPLLGRYLKGKGFQKTGGKKDPRKEGRPFPFTRREQYRGQRS